jgi:hypothetical protein
MKSLFIMAVVAATALQLGGCRDKKPEPVPGPQSALSVRVTAADVVRANIVATTCPARHRDVSEIAWFQGTLEEAFSYRGGKGRGSAESRSLFHD